MTAVKTMSAATAAAKIKQERQAVIIVCKHIFSPPLNVKLNLNYSSPQKNVREQKNYVALFSSL
jgi:hypothetical protein